MKCISYFMQIRNFCIINTVRYYYIVSNRFDWCVYNNMDSDHLMCQSSYPDRLNSRQKEEDWKQAFCFLHLLCDTPSLKQKPITDHFLYFVTSFPVCLCMFRLLLLFYISAAFCFFSECLRRVVVERQFMCNDVCGELWRVRVVLNTYVYMLW